jgi:hypothetical protein
MSRTHRVKVWEEYDLPSGPRDYLVALVKFMKDDHDIVYRSQAEITWETGRARSTIQEIEDRLIERHWLIVVEPAKQNRPTKFRVNWSALPPKEPFDPEGWKKRKRGASGPVSRPLQRPGVEAPVETPEARFTASSGPVSTIQRPGGRAQHVNEHVMNTSVVLTDNGGAATVLEVDERGQARGHAQQRILKDLVKALERQGRYPLDRGKKNIIATQIGHALDEGHPEKVIAYVTRQLALNEYDFLRNDSMRLLGYVRASASGYHEFRPADGGVRCTQCRAPDMVGPHVLQLREPQ